MRATQRVGAKLAWTGAVGLNALAVLTAPAMAQVNVGPGLRQSVAFAGYPPAGWIEDTVYTGRASGTMMSPAEIVEMVRPESPRISPDGSRVAYLTRQARLATNDYRVRLHVADATGQTPPRELASARSISNLRWTADGSTLLYIVEDGEGSRVEARSIEGEVSVVFGVVPLLFEPAPTGRSIAYVAPADSASTEYDGRGIVYDEEVHSSSNATKGTWSAAVSGSAVWIRRPGEGDRILWESARGVDGIVWSPNGQSLAVSYEAPSRPDQGGTAFNADLGVLAVADGAFTVVSSAPGAIRSPAWSPDGNNLAYLTHAYPTARVTRVDLRTRTTTDVPIDHWMTTSADLWWPDAATLLAGQTDRGGSGIYAISLDGGSGGWRTPVAHHISSCSLSTDHSRAACIRQTPVSPPEVVVVDLDRGAVQVLTRLNPAIEEMALGAVRELTWANAYGDTTNGWLVYPPDYQPGRRYPLLSVLYGFSGEFVSQAEWISSLPAQTLAADGFLVFLINYPPRAGQTVSGDYEEARIGEGWSPLSSIRIAVDRLVDEGVADPDRKGMMGWSYGGFLTQFALTQDPDLFQAGSAGECGLWDPGLYWHSGSRRFQRVAENIHGSPPYGALDRWAEFSPAMNAQRVKAPLMAESADGRASMLEFYTAMRRQGKPMELVFYPGEGHIFSEPRHRLSSMERNRDWFNFWLRDVRLDPSREAERYARWESMRALLRP